MKIAFNLIFSSFESIIMFFFSDDKNSSKFWHFKVQMGQSPNVGENCNIQHYCNNGAETAIKYTEPM